MSNDDFNVRVKFIYDTIQGQLELDKALLQIQNKANTVPVTVKTSTKAQAKEYTTTWKQALSAREIRYNEVMARSAELQSTMNKKEIADQQKLANQIGALREKSMIKSATAETNLNLKQTQAMNKVLDQQYIAKQKINNASTNAIKKTGLLKGVFTSFGGVLKNVISDIGKFLEFWVAGGIIIGAITGIKDVATRVIDLNKAETQLIIVNNTLKDGISDFTSEANELAIELGTLTKTILSSAEDFQRAGFSIEASMNLARDAILGANAGAVTLDESTTFIVAGLKAFNLETTESTRIIDTLFGVSRQAAINFKGIGEAFLLSANSLATAGMSLEQASATIAAANTSIQDASKAGTALKTIAARLRGVGEEAEQFPKLEESLLGIGVAVRSSEGSFRNMYDILKDITGVYSDLDDFTKQDILEKLGGKRQANILAGLFNQFSVAEASLETALNSAGESAKANEIFLNSFEGKVSVLNATVDKLYMTILSSDALITLVEQITGFVEGTQIAVTNTDILISRIIQLTSVITALKSASIAGALTKTTTGLFASLTVTAPQVIAVVVILGSLAKIYDEVRSYSEKLRIETEKFAEAEQDLTRIIKSGGYEAEQKRDSLRELFKEYTLATEELDKYKEALDDSNGMSKVASKDYAELANQVGIIDQKFKDEGTTAELVSENMEKLNNSLKETATFNQKLKDLDLTTEMKEEANNAKQLAIFYEKLSNQKERTEVEDKKLETVSKILSSKLEELGIKIKGNVQDYDVNTEALKLLIDEKYNLLEATETAEFEALEIERNSLEERESNIKKELTMRRLLREEISKGAKNFEDYHGAISFDFFNSINSKEDSSLEGELERVEREFSTINEKLKSRTTELIDSLNDSSDSSDTSSDSIENLTQAQRDLLTIENKVALAQEKMNRLSEDDTDYLVEKTKLLTILADLEKERYNNLQLQIDELQQEGQQLDINTPKYDEYIAQLRDLTLQQEQALTSAYNYAQEQKALSETFDANALKEYNEKVKENEEAVDALRESISKMVEQELNDKIDSYEKSIELAKEELDIRLAQIEAEKDLADFAKDRAESEEDISKMVSKLSTLTNAANQGDRKAQAEAITLEEEIAEEKEALDELVNERSYDLRKENLEDQYDEFEDTQNDEIDALEDKLDDASYITQQVDSKLKDFLETSTSTLYDNLIDWNSKFGTSFEKDILDNWTKAIEAIKEYTTLSGKTYDSSEFTAEQSVEKESNPLEGTYDYWINQSSTDKNTKLHLDYLKDNPDLSQTIVDKVLNFLNKFGVIENDTSGNTSSTSSLSSGNYSTEQIDSVPSSISTSSSSGVPTSSISNSSSYSSSPQINLIVEGGIDNSNITTVKQSLSDLSNELTKSQLDSFKLKGVKTSLRV